MVWDQGIDLSRRKFTARLIVERALSRGWKVKGFETNTAIHLLYIPGRSQPVKIFSASPQQMSYPAAKIAQDKCITNRLLHEQGLPVPDELLVHTDRPFKTDEVQQFLRRHRQVVVKPLDASHGKGVTTGITTLDQLHRALKTAKNESAKNIMLLQQQLSGHDIRIVVIGYEFCDAITRIPAAVVGDDTRTIQELIELENQREERGDNYMTRLNVIPLEKTREFLGAEGLSYVAATGEPVQVIGVSNVGMGGERHNNKQAIPAWLRDMAATAAKALELPVCGVDFMVKDLPESTSTPEQLVATIIEVNECPMLTMYDDLHSDEQNVLIDRYLDYLAK